MRLSFMALCLAASWGPSAHASTARRLSLQELVRRSDLIVLGQVEQEESFWQGPRIYTLSKVRVDELWAGRDHTPQQVNVLTLGGQVGDIGQRVEGASAPMVGERVVMTLKAAAGGEHLPVGMAQGIFVIEPLPLRPGVSRPGVDRLVGGLRYAPIPQTLSSLKSAIQEAWHAQHP